MFHFSDDDLFPFPCPGCGEKLEKSVGWLKTNTRLKCPECERNVWFYNETFLRALDQAERAINDFGRDIRFGKDEP